jgi:hypothetical protein
MGIGGKFSCGFDEEERCGFAKSFLFFYGILLLGLPLFDIQMATRDSDKGDSARLSWFPPHLLTGGWDL